MVMVMLCALCCFAIHVIDVHFSRILKCFAVKHCKGMCVEKCAIVATRILVISSLFTYFIFSYFFTRGKKILLFDKLWLTQMEVVIPDPIN